MLWNGLDSAGNPQGYLHGKVSREDYAGIVYGTKVPELVYGGPALPPVSGSLRNDISYKAFTLSFNISYRFGITCGKVPLTTTSYFMPGTAIPIMQKDGSSPAMKKHTNVPSPIYPDDPLSG